MSMPCPNPWKVRFPNPEDADRALGRCWRQMRRCRLPARAYLCPCGHWHLTHRPDTHRPQFEAVG